MRSVLGLTLLVLGAGRASHAQGSETFSLDGPSGTYAITVALPPGYDADAPDPYPVLYVLDGWWLRDLATGIVQIATVSLQTDVEPLVVVSIGVEGDEAAWTAQRSRDLTPGSYRSPVAGVTMTFSGVALDSAATGGADAFLAFLERDLFPRVEASVRTAPDRRGLVGHSLGGLFGAWVLQARPDVFERVLLVSPSTWWRGGELLEGGYDEAQTLDRRAFVAVGGAEDRLLTRGVEALDEALRADGLAFTLRTYPDATHTSVLPRAIWDGLVALYGR